MYLKHILFLCFFLQTVFSAQAQTVINKSEHNNSIEHAILIEVNAYRQKYHLAPLTMNTSISAQARNHSIEMANHHVPFGHQHFSNRVANLRKDMKDTGAIAENVAYNYRDAHDVVKNWMQSPGHKKNILGNYNLTGIGVIRDSAGKIHFTQMFVKVEPHKNIHSHQTLHSRAYATKIIPSFSLGPIFKRSAS